MILTVIGIGLIGGSMAMELKQRNFAPKLLALIQIKSSKDCP